jgi:primosomal protein N'
MSIPAALKKVIEKHLPPEESSSRSIQRVCALFLGQGGKKFTKDALYAACDGFNLFSYEGAAGRNTFAANFTQNMKKDVAYFKGDHESGWKLTPDGNAEAKRIFTEGQAPTKRRPGPTAKAKTSKKAKAKKAKKKATKAKAKKKAKTAKKVAAKKKTKTSKKKATPQKATKKTSKVQRKAAVRRKKRELKGNKTTAPATAAAATGSGDQSW